MRLYEAMFVVQNNAAKENYEKIEAEVQGCITRFDGEIKNSIKWDERRLAYEINNQKRATYILVHFEAGAESISKIERQCRLSEVILRVLITLDVDGLDCQPYSPATESSYGETKPEIKRTAKVEIKTESKEVAPVQKKLATETE